MSKDRPVWLRDDGTDEWLVNPIADMVRNFSHFAGDGHPPRADKVQTIEQSHPEFAQSLLALTAQLDSLDLMSRIVTGNFPSQEEISQHEQLVRERLQITQQFVENTYGSVEAFMKWFIGWLI